MPTNSAIAAIGRRCAGSTVIAQSNVRGKPRTLDCAMTVLPAQRLPIAAMALLVGIGTVAEVYAVSRGAEISRGAGQLWYVCFSYAVAWWVEIDRKAKAISAI